MSDSQDWLSYAVAGPIGLQISQAEKARKMQKESLKRQEAAQSTARGMALREEKRAAEARRRASARTPDIAALLSEAQKEGLSGASSTMLTGPGGINPDSLQLSRNRLLGT